MCSSCPSAVIKTLQLIPWVWFFSVNLVLPFTLSFFSSPGSQWFRLYIMVRFSFFPLFPRRCSLSLTDIPLLNIHGPDNRALTGFHIKPVLLQVRFNSHWFSPGFEIFLKIHCSREQHRILRSNRGCGSYCGCSCDFP